MDQESDSCCFVVRSISRALERTVNCNEAVVFFMLDGVC
jgi:hypothetical protein